MVVRNEEDALERSVRSVLEQTHENLELLIIDGASTDRTREVAERIAFEDQRVRVLTNPMMLIPAGLNIGLQEAQGELVARLDGHATWSADHLEFGVRFLVDDEGVVAVGGRRDGVASSPRGRAIAAALGSRFGVGNSLYHYGTVLAETDHATSGVYRAEAIRSLAGWDETLPANEDVDLDHRLRMAGWRIFFNPKMRTSWQVRSTFGALSGQYRRYGRGKAAMLRKNGIGALRARHLAAPGLVVAITASFVVGSRRSSAAVLLSYLALVGGAGAHVAGRHRGAGPVEVSAALATMHLSWGVGFLEGLVFRSEPAYSTPRG